MAAYDSDILLKWQHTFITMLSSTVRENMPMEKLGLSSFADMLKQSRNSEEGLLAIHAACFNRTKEIIKGEHWGDPTAFGAFWKRVQGQRSGSENPLVARTLIGLDLGNCILYISDFYGANLALVNFQNASLGRADLGEANLEGANLKGANLMRSTLDGANLDGANLGRASLDRASLKGASLKGASLKGTSLEEAIVKDTILEKNMHLNLRSGSSKL